MEQEFHHIYKTYASDLYHFIFKMCGNETLAKDILQDTMLKAMTTADKFKGNCSAKTWLCTIAKNLYYDYLKQAEQKNLLTEDFQDFSDNTSTEQKISDSETALHIHHVLHRLEEPYREVFTLRVFAELKFSEIGSVFGKSENWAGVTFYRSKQKLIEMLKQEDLL